VTVRIYPGMGHVVNEDELEFARALMTRVAAS
jgi:predicted esterase